jgi:peptidoglycan/xylan/chitin deacetylase (PgdA/CDA1 family)
MQHQVKQGGAAPLNKQPRWPPILMYHAITRVRKDPDSICISPERFESQMRTLERCNLRGVSVQALLGAMRAGESRGLVGLTFDDGYQDFLRSAVPVLEKFGFTATVFVVGNMLGGENTWVQTPRLRLLSANEIREVAERGIEIGSHSLNHSRLTSELGIEALQLELSHSRKILNEVVHSEIGGLAYPWGDVDNGVLQAVQQAGFTYACGGSVLGRGAEWGSIYNTPRIFVSERDTPFRLLSKLLIHKAYSRVAHTFIARRSRYLLRRYLSKYWFSSPRTPS